MELHRSPAMGSRRRPVIHVAVHPDLLAWLESQREWGGERVPLSMVVRRILQEARTAAEG